MQSWEPDPPNPRRPVGRGRNRRLIPVGWDETIARDFPLWAHHEETGKRDCIPGFNRPDVRPVRASADPTPQGVVSPSFRPRGYRLVNCPSRVHDVEESQGGSPPAVIDRPAEANPAEALDWLLALAGLTSLQIEQNKQLTCYLSLLLRWNARTNLTAVRDPDAILQRHFVESIACAQALPAGIATLLDYGSGAGFPGIPIAVCRHEIAVTLAESQNKKAAFLQEAIRVTGPTARVHSGRAETLAAKFDCVTLRAVDHMDQAVQSAARLVAPNGWLAPLTTRAELTTLKSSIGSIPGPHFSWSEPIALAGSDQRILALAHRLNVPS